MALEWDPTTLTWQWGGGADPYGRAALAGQIVPELGVGQQYDIGLEAAMPGYQENPYSKAYAQRSLSPLYGRFLASGAPGEWTGTEAPPTFAQYTRNAMTGARGGKPLVTNLSTQNWQDILNVARSQALGTGWPQPSAELEGKWGPMLENPQEVAALTAMATYDPYAGGIYGGLRQRGLDVMRRRFLAGDADPASAGSRWLTHLMGGAGGAYINPAYQYAGTVPTGATGITPAAGPQDPRIIGGTIDDPIYAVEKTEPPWFPVRGAFGQEPAGGVNPNRPTTGDFEPYLKPPGAQWHY